MPVEIIPGVFHYPGWLDAGAQEQLAQEIAEVIARAPLFVSRMPKSGLPMSVRMTNCGPLGWYRYEPLHPETGQPWPPMPPMLLDLWATLTGYPKPPEACLVNVYSAEAKMGLHQDRDEVDFDAPILSVRAADGRPRPPCLARHRPPALPLFPPSAGWRAHQPDAPRCQRPIDQLSEAFLPV